MRVSYVRLYADDDGESHFEDLAVDLEERDFAPPAAPPMVAPFLDASGTLLFGVNPSWSGEAPHRTPHSQIFCVMRGDVEVTVSDGEMRAFSPGALIVLDDTGGKGHSTRVAGGEDLVLFGAVLADQSPSTGQTRTDLITAAAGGATPPTIRASARWPASERPATPCAPAMAPRTIDSMRKTSSIDRSRRSVPAAFASRMGPFDELRDDQPVLPEALVRAGVLASELREGVHPRHRVDHAPQQHEERVGVVRVVRGELDDPLDPLAEDLGRERAAVREVAVERRLPDAGTARHLAHRDVGRVGEELAPRLQDRFAVAPGIPAEPPGVVSCTVTPPCINRTRIVHEAAERCPGPRPSITSSTGHDCPFFVLMPSGRRSRPREPIHHMPQLHRPR